MKRLRAKLISAGLLLCFVALGGNSAEASCFSAELLPDETPIPATEDMFVVEIIEQPSAGYVGKRVLIYHTHTYEAYEQIEGDEYQAVEKWRTADPDHNMIAVGRALASSLKALGINVVHDETAFEPPNLENAYERSLQMLERRQAAGEKYDFYLDLHRDALASSSTVKRTVNIGGEEVARFMVLVGQGTTGGYAEKPDWEANLQIARVITDALNEQCGQLARDVKIKTGRFNQHISQGCLLIECGMNDNTLEQVIAGIPYLAEAIAQSLNQ